MDENSHLTSRWRLVVMVGAYFSISFIEIGVVKSFGVIIHDLAFQLESDLGKTGMIIGLFHGISCILGTMKLHSFC